MPGKRYYKKDKVKCGIDKCKLQATWKSTKGPRCGRHRTDGSKFKYDNYVHKRQYHWDYAGIDITYTQYEKKLLQQKERCMICNRDFSEFKSSPHVDHNHETGQVRGLLCPKCNRDVEIIESGDAIKVQEYLDYWESGN